MLNDLTFFHQATMRICGSLDVSRMIRDCDAFLRQFLPSNGMMLCCYDPGPGMVRILASSPNLPVPLKNRSVFLSRQARSFIQKKKAGSIIYHYKEANPVSQEIGDILGLSFFSHMVLHLHIDEQTLGVVQIFARDNAEFTEEHARLLCLLHDPFAIAMANVLRHRELIRLKDLLADDNRYLRQELRHISGDEIVGARYGLRNVMEQVWQVSSLTCPVLLTGETGAGKEVIANAIHYSSPRSENPFIKVNCGAFTESLLDSELFGHEKGAFTGAMKSRRGRFERAHKGTLFLDEVGELTPAAQIRLLRVVQDGRIERLGSAEPVNVDVRIIAATHRNLLEMVRQGSFREDLWFRLNVFPIHIPPLRERKSDIPALVHHFIARKLKVFNLTEHPAITADMMEQLARYSWPGNVRELENMVERALIRHQSKDAGSPLYFDCHVNGLTDVTVDLKTSADVSGSFNLEDITRQHICKVLRATHGKIQGKDGAAEILGLNANTLRSRMNKLGIAYGRTKRRQNLKNTADPETCEPAAGQSSVSV